MISVAELEVAIAQDEWDEALARVDDMFPPEQRQRIRDLAPQHQVGFVRIHDAIRKLVEADACWAIEEERSAWQRFRDALPGRDVRAEVIACVGRLYQA